MFKGLWFWCGTAFVFFQAASKQPLKPYLPKTVPPKPYILKNCIITVNLDEVGGYGFLFGVRFKGVL